MDSLALHMSGDGEAKNVIGLVVPPLERIVRLFRLTLHSKAKKTYYMAEDVIVTSRS